MRGGWFRRTTFWALDALRGGAIKRHYREVKRACDMGICNQEQLKALLNHAVQTTSFYQQCDPSDFYSFPVLSKHVLKEHLESVQSDKYVDIPLYETSTSGSTGIPLKMYWDAEKRNRQQAEMIYFYERADHWLGERFVFFRENQHRKTKKKFTQWMRNMYDYDVTSFSDEKLEEICRRLAKRPRIQSYIAYGSFHEAVLKHLRSGDFVGKRFLVDSVVTSSEVFGLEAKKELSSRLGAKVFDRYSNEENGFIAQTENVSDEFWVNVASFRVEILRQDSDLPARPGEVGRIVVTDLYNFAVPLIRYDTGDLSICAGEKEGWVTRLKTIQGRQSDVIYDTSGAQMTTSVWNAYMGDFKDLKQYQLIQEGAKAYKLRVNGAKGKYSDESLVRALRMAVGSDAEVTVEHVDGIPTLSSGKFKKTVCNYQYNKADYL